MPSPRAMLNSMLQQHAPTVVPSLCPGIASIAAAVGVCLSRPSSLVAAVGTMKLHVALAGVLGACAAAIATAVGPTVTTTTGTVSGATQGGVDGYLGVPFAAPPSGVLRFAAPTAHP
eukprot:COSAG06_NODE_28481_length_573_cov_1.297468_1_plen_116_part_10